VIKKSPVEDRVVIIRARQRVRDHIRNSGRLVVSSLASRVDVPLARRADPTKHKQRRSEVTPSGKKRGTRQCLVWGLTVHHFSKHAMPTRVAWLSPSTLLAQDSQRN